MMGSSLSIAGFLTPDLLRLLGRAAHSTHGFTKCQDAGKQNAFLFRLLGHSSTWLHAPDRDLAAGWWVYTIFWAPSSTGRCGGSSGPYSSFELQMFKPHMSSVVCLFAVKYHPPKFNKDFIFHFANFLLIVTVKYDLFLFLVIITFMSISEALSDLVLYCLLQYSIVWIMYC